MNREAQKDDKHSRRRMRSIGGEAKEQKQIMWRRKRYSERARTSRRMRGRMRINTMIKATNDRQGESGGE
eukprot:7688797-Heterocapsa_arctica.AAC.1